MLQGQQQQQGPQLSPQDTQQYNKMRQDYADIFRVFLDIEDERKEHNLVIDAIKNLDSSRRCWRLVGGVLVERKLDEVKSSLLDNIEMLDKTSTNYNTVMKNKEKDLIDFEMKNNIRPSQSSSQTQSTQVQAQNAKNTGVLT